MGIASLGLLAPAAGALLQEGIDIASIANALRASRDLPRPDGPHFTNDSGYRHHVNVHRGVAIGCFALSTIGGAMTWFWK